MCIKVSVCACVHLFPSCSQLSGLLVPTLMASLPALSSAHSGKVKDIQRGPLSVYVISLTLSFSTLAIRFDIKQVDGQDVSKNQRNFFYYDK